MAASRRVVLLGKSGCGKSSLANTIFGEAIFKVNHGSDSVYKFSEARTRTVKGLNLTLIDTPGIYNMDRTDEEVQCEIYSCYTKSAPGPHAFLIVLLVEKFTEQEQGMVDQIRLHFGEDVFRFSTVVFTHGDQLSDGMEIMEFVNQSAGLKELIQKCGGRCLAIDNKYWKSGDDPYRSNSVQVENILKSIQIIVEANNGRFFTNVKFLQVERAITTEQNLIHASQGLTLDESRESAENKVLQEYIKKVKRQRYMKYALYVGMPCVTLLFIGYKVVSYFRGRAASGPGAGVDGVSAAAVEGLQDSVASIKGILDYVISAIFQRQGSQQITAPNDTHTDL